jgi:hypothetical protein
MYSFFLLTEEHLDNRGQSRFHPHPLSISPYYIENVLTMLNDDKENRMKVRLLYEKPRSSKPNKTITKEQPAMIYIDLKEKAFLILSSNDTFQQSD